MKILKIILLGVLLSSCATYQDKLPDNNDFLFPEFSYHDSNFEISKFPFGLNFNNKSLVINRTENKCLSSKLNQAPVIPVSQSMERDDYPIVADKYIQSVKILQDYINDLKSCGN
jgi:hypothetical protein